MFRPFPRVVIVPSDFYIFFWLVCVFTEIIFLKRTASLQSSWLEGSDSPMKVATIKRFAAATFLRFFVVYAAFNDASGQRSNNDAP